MLRRVVAAPARRPEASRRSAGRTAAKPASTSSPGRSEPGAPPGQPGYGRASAAASADRAAAASAATAGPAHPVPARTAAPAPAGLGRPLRQAGRRPSGGTSGGGSQTGGPGRCPQNDAFPPGRCPGQAGAVHLQFRRGRARLAGRQGQRRVSSPISRWPGAPAGATGPRPRGASPPRNPGRGPSAPGGPRLCQGLQSPPPCPDRPLAAGDRAGAPLPSRSRARSLPLPGTPASTSACRSRLGFSGTSRKRRSYPRRTHPRWRPRTRRHRDDARLAGPLDAQRVQGRRRLQVAEAMSGISMAVGSR